MSTNSAIVTGNRLQVARHLGVSGQIGVDMETLEFRLYDGVTMGGFRVKAFPEVGDSKAYVRTRGEWLDISEVEVGSPEISQLVTIPDAYVLYRDGYDIRVSNSLTGDDLYTVPPNADNVFSVKAVDRTQGIIYAARFSSGILVKYDWKLEYLGEWTLPDGVSANSREAIINTAGNMVGIYKVDADSTYSAIELNPADGTVVNRIDTVDTAINLNDKIIELSDGTYYLVDGTKIHKIDFVAGTVTEALVDTATLHLFPTSAGTSQMFLVKFGSPENISIVDESLTEVVAPVNLTNLSYSAVGGYGDRIVLGDIDSNVLRCYDTTLTEVWQTKYGDAQRPETTDILVTPRTVAAYHQFDDGVAYLNLETGELIKVVGMPDTPQEVYTLFNNPAAPGQF